MKEYGVSPAEDGWCMEGVQHVQLGYTLYAALLAAFEETSLRGGGTRGEGKQENAPLTAGIAVGAEGGI